MDKALLYRKFRRRVVSATAALFALGLVAALLLRTGGSIWVTATWTAVCSPIVVGIGICLMAPIERMAVHLGLSHGGRGLRLRPTVVLWFISAVALPWISAWVISDLMGRWFEMSWQANGGDGPAIYLWTIRMVSGIMTYSLASALGLFIAFYLDRSLDDEAGQPR